MRRLSTSSKQIWPLPAWVLALGGLILLVFLILCYILFWPRHPGAPRGGPTQPPSHTSRLAPPSKLRHSVTAPPAAESQAPAAESSSQPILPAPPVQSTVPADTEIAIRTSKLIDSDAAPVGSRFPGTVTAPIAINGQTVVPQGSPVVLNFLGKKKTGFFHRSLQMRVALTGISVNGRIYPVQVGVLSIKAGENNGSPEAKGKKVLVILPNSEMTFTLSAPLTIVTPTAPASPSVNSSKAK